MIKKIDTRQFSPEKDHAILKMYESGLNTVQIANHFKTWNTSIRRVLLRHNITPLTNSEANRMIKPTFFNNWEDREKLDVCRASRAAPHASDQHR